MNATAAERQELERAIGLLGRSTRHARLLEYAGGKYFQQQEDQLTEFNIATEVFGRSPNRFDSTQDAVVRVEVHRLRKKLREIYEKDTRTEGLQISLPPGTYVPKFTPVPAPLAAAAGEADHETGSSRRFPQWALFLSIAVAAGVLITSLLYDRRQAVPSTAPPSPSVNSAAPANVRKRSRADVVFAIAG